MMLDFVLYLLLIALYAMTLVEMGRIRKTYVLMVQMTAQLEARVARLEGGESRAG